MQYSYVATTRTGEMQRGMLEAASPQEVKGHLQELGLIPITIQVGNRKGARIPGLGAPRHGRFRVSLLDRVIFARHLSIMLQSGLPLVEALDVLREQTTGRMQEVIVSIRKDIMNGSSLAASLDAFPKVFSGIFIGMVRVGEASGTLERNLDYVAGQLERDFDLRRKVKSAMLYPTVVLSGVIVLGTVLSVFILPKLVRLFTTFKLELPLATRVFLNVATFLVDYGWYVLGGAVVMIAILIIIGRLKAVRPFLHELVLHIPVLRGLLRGMNLARMTRAMNILLKSGVPITDSLSITAQVVGNVRYQQQCTFALTQIQQGGLLSAALSNRRYIPPMTSRMIGVGEKSGKLEESLAYLAGFYEGEVDTITKNLSTVIEPFLLVIIGIVLGFLAVAIISPIYQFTGSIGR